MPPTLASLKHAADLAIRGRIASVADVTTDAHGSPYTDFHVTVSKVLVSKSGQSGASMLLHQTGAQEGSTLYQVDDDPLFTVGEQVILFLHQYAPGHFFVIGGPEGRFGLQLAPIPESDFENSIASAWPEATGIAGPGDNS